MGRYCIDFFCFLLVKCFSDITRIVVWVCIECGTMPASTLVAVGVRRRAPAAAHALPAGAGNRMRCSALTLKAGARLSYGVYMLTDCSGRFVFMVCPICLSFTRGDFIE